MEKKQRMQLNHEEWPGYKPVFYIAITATVVYLALVLVLSVL